MPDISKDYMHLMRKPVKCGIADGLVRQFGLYLQAQGISDRFRKEKDQRDDPAANPEIYNRVSLLNGDEFGQQDGINGEPVTGPGLDQPQAAVHEIVY